MKSQEALLKEGEVKKVIRKEDENVKRFPIIIKADVQGSLEAIQQILGAIEHPEVALDEVAAGVGSITESDVKLAASSGAKIFGFNAEPTSVAKRIAETSGVAIQSFSIIYKLVETVKNDLAALLPPEIVRTDFGQLSILAVFKSGKRDMIVGGRVAEGKIIRGSLLEVKRDGEIVGSGKMGNLQQNKKNAEEVGQGNECGLVFDGTVKLAVGDTLISYQVEEKRRSL
jgi:translation initiation factor IF-2